MLSVALVVQSAAQEYDEIFSHVHQNAAYLEIVAVNVLASILLVSRGMRMRIASLIDKVQLEMTETVD